MQSAGSVLCSHSAEGLPGGLLVFIHLGGLHRLPIKRIISKRSTIVSPDSGNWGSSDRCCIVNLFWWVVDQILQDPSQALFTWSSAYSDKASECFVVLSCCKWILSNNWKILSDSRSSCRTTRKTASGSNKVLWGPFYFVLRRNVVKETTTTADSCACGHNTCDVGDMIRVVSTSMSISFISWKGLHTLAMDQRRVHVGEWGMKCTSCRRSCRACKSDLSQGCRRDLWFEEKQWNRLRALMVF